jgi:hypothetical protein
MFTRKIMGMWLAVRHSMPGHQHPCLSSSKEPRIPTACRVPLSRGNRQLPPLPPIPVASFARQARQSTVDASCLGLSTLHPAAPGGTRKYGANRCRIRGHCRRRHRSCQPIFGQGFTICCVRSALIVRVLHRGCTEKMPRPAGVRGAKKRFFCNKRTFPSV